MISSTSRNISILSAREFGVPIPSSRKLAVPDLLVSISPQNGAISGVGEVGNSTEENALTAFKNETTPFSLICEMIETAMREKHRNFLPRLYNGTKHMRCIYFRGTASLGLIFEDFAHFLKKIKQLWTKYPMDLVRNVPRN